MVEMLTPKESNVYSKLICLPTCDTEGVERECKRRYGYKHVTYSRSVLKNAISNQ
jgi:hypothetical protein